MALSNHSDITTLAGFQTLSALLFACLFSAMGCTSSPSPTIDIDLIHPYSPVVVTGAKIEKSTEKKMLRIYTGDSLPSTEMQAYPVMGSYEWKQDSLTFIPRMPWQPGQTYFIHLNVIPPQTQVFSIPRPINPELIHVTAIHPVDSVLPSNLLRFYIHFSAPMHLESPLDHIRLFNSKGETIEKSFVVTRPALWNRDYQRLTVLLHPGRVKQGLELHDRMGPVLEVGQTYTLVVDSMLKDGNGRHIQPLKKKFRVSSEDRISPGPTEWEMKVPVAGSRESFSLFFFETLDLTLLHTMIEIQDENGTPISGKTEVDEGGEFWQFQPSDSWKSGKYRVAVNVLLEDLAGNNLAELFEEKEKKKEHMGFQYLPFEI